MQTIILILISVTLSTVAQVFLKFGMSLQSVQSALDTGGTQLILASINVWVISGLLLYGLGAVLWLLVLAKADLSYAYPFVGLGFILTLIFSVVLIGETVTLTRILGTCLVVAGVVLISNTAQA